MDKKSVENITIFLKNTQQRVNAALENILANDHKLPTHLHSAMRYSLFNGGKRLRPALVYATGELYAVNNTLLDQAACALELIHTFSLVHDDLPAMDNDTLRRGKPTCHIAFNEPIAILVGDALQSLAFECLANTYLSWIKILAKATGAEGMAGGQAMDIENIGKSLNIDSLILMHQFKTGALIKAAVQIPAYEFASVKELANLMIYAEKIGLAFQIQDDILDVESTTQILGKSIGKDVTNNKPTFPQLLGLEESKNFAKVLYNDAMNALADFDYRADNLRAIAKFAIERRN